MATVVGTVTGNRQSTNFSAAEQDALWKEIKALWGHRTGNVSFSLAELQAFIAAQTDGK